MNIYLKAMEIAYNNRNGITYEELKKNIKKSLKIEIQGKTEFAFFSWFLKNFSAIELHDTNLNYPLYQIGQFLIGNKGDADCNRRMYEKYITFKFFIEGETLKQYIDYLELSHAKKSSRNAFILATISILLSAGSFLFYFSNPSPQPPYEVIVIDSKEEISPFDSTIIIDTDISNDTIALDKSTTKVQNNKDSK